MASPTRSSSPASEPKTRRPAPCAFVIFGARGDLTKRLVVPALYNLARYGLLPARFALVGVDHGEEDSHGWRQHLLETLQTFVGNPHSEFSIPELDVSVWNRLANTMTYVRGDFIDPQLYRDLGPHLDQVAEGGAGGANILFYLAVADRFFAPIIEQLAQAGLTRLGGGTGWRRVVVEKPFGNDLQSARALNRRILQSLDESQVFRIDHFLGKTAIQNILPLRFANPMFEPIWNSEHVDHVQVTVAETIGVENRGRFYEATGALRDMIPNHLFSLLSLIAMERPEGMDARGINAAKAKALSAVAAIDRADAVRGQYGPGHLDGAPAIGYRQAPNVSSQSNVETYVALKLAFDNARWRGVPFYLRTGKHLAARVTEVSLALKQAGGTGSPAISHSPCWLTLRISPDEGLSWQFQIGRPFPDDALSAVAMDFTYAKAFGRETNIGYEILLNAVMTGDATHFMSAETVEESWRIIQPLIDAWQGEAPRFPNYASGSAGPAAADTLIANDGGRAWRPVGVEPSPHGSGGAYPVSPEVRK